MKDQPLTDPREIRKLLTEVAYRDMRVDGTGQSNRYSMVGGMVRRVLDVARYQGLSGEDHMTLLAYHVLLGYEKAMDMVLEEAMTRPVARLVVDPSKVGP